MRFGRQDGRPVCELAGRKRTGGVGCGKRVASGSHAGRGFWRAREPEAPRRRPVRANRPRGCRQTSSSRRQGQIRVEGAIPEPRRPSINDARPRRPGVLPAGPGPQARKPARFRALGPHLSAGTNRTRQLAPSTAFCPQAAHTKTGQSLNTTDLQEFLVAGAGFEPTTFGL